MAEFRTLLEAGLSRPSGRPRRGLAPDVLAARVEHGRGILRRMGYEMTEGNREAVEVMLRFAAEFCAARRGECDLPVRGVYLFGKPGVGKTALAEAVAGRICMIPCASAALLARRYAERPAWAINTLDRWGWDEFAEVDETHLVIDDLGNTGQAAHYGRQLDGAEIIRMRHDQLVRHGTLTIITGNFDGREALAAWAGPQASRLAEMCDCVMVTGTDQRTARGRSRR